MEYVDTCIDKRDHTDSRLHSCPVCGGEAFYRQIVVCRGSNSTGVLPEGAVVYKTATPMSGKPAKLFFWERYGFAVHCMTPKCQCRTASVGFPTLDEAIEAWNGDPIGNIHAEDKVNRNGLMTVKEIRSITGLSQVEFGKRYDIPRRTIQNWECNKNSAEYRECPVYVLKLLERAVREDFGK